ncbi:hypothetical protein S7711_11035 [Stachybotrys chartarum IBT 7711]|jgi:hypothetical protein|uniref:Uncharacterized protein n=1 Tax=Stachybotrys chartarum (strain CBS 109288 / IBT 7711) TaxID=1280523 RepID=A0A084AX56_STACB|nr:hypothetical protein S7711_11035 [Stachybotrys chartarum IBT 7711]KFA54855.1 hypothetical protein S40293_10427 [Stachybotrys chartarum IBT 40293]
MFQGRRVANSVLMTKVRSAVAEQHHRPAQRPLQKTGFWQRHEESILWKRGGGTSPASQRAANVLLDGAGQQRGPSPVTWASGHRQRPADDNGLADKSRSYQAKNSPVFFF